MIMYRAHGWKILTIRIAFKHFSKYWVRTYYTNIYHKVTFFYLIVLFKYLLIKVTYIKKVIWNKLTLCSEHVRNTKHAAFDLQAAINFRSAIDFRFGIVHGNHHTITYVKRFRKIQVCCNVGNCIVDLQL